MTSPTPPTIADVYAQKRAAFERHTPFGILLKHDMIGLVRSTARDAKCSVADVHQAAMDEAELDAKGETE